MRTPSWEGVYLEDGLRWISLPVSGVQALICQWGTHISVRNVSELPLEWSSGQQTCEDGWGCQDTLILIENGEKGPVGPKPDSHPLPGETSFPALSYCTLCRDSEDLPPPPKSCPLPSRNSPWGAHSPLSPQTTLQTLPRGSWSPDPQPLLPQTQEPGPPHLFSLRPWSPSPQPSSSLRPRSPGPDSLLVQEPK